MRLIKLLRLFLLFTMFFVLVVSIAGCGNGDNDGIELNDKVEETPVGENARENDKNRNQNEVEETEYWAELRMVQGYGALFRVFVEDTNVPDGVLFSVEDGTWESPDKTIGDGNMVERFFMEDTLTLNIKNSAGETIQSRAIELPAGDLEERVPLASYQ